MRGGQKMIWQRDMKQITEALSKVEVVRLPDWGPRDTSVKWLSTLRNMAANRNQWCECFRMLTESL